MQRFLNARESCEIIFVFRKLEGANRMAEGFNPLCGDRFTVYLHMEGDVIQDISFQGAGCAISKASASVMTSTLKGKSKAEAQAIIERFHLVVTRGSCAGVDPLEPDEFGAFAGVREFPLRVKCASLAWHTLRAAMDGKEATVSNGVDG